MTETLRRRDRWRLQMFSWLPHAGSAGVLTWAARSIQSRQVQDHLGHSGIVLFGGSGRHPGADFLLGDRHHRGRYLVFNEGRRSNLEVLRKELGLEPRFVIALQNPFAV